MVQLQPNLCLLKMKPVYMLTYLREVWNVIEMRNVAKYRDAVLINAEI